MRRRINSLHWHTSGRRYRLHEVNEKLTVNPQAGVFDGNKRKEIRVKMTGEKQAVVIGINPSTAHDGKIYDMNVSGRK